MKGLYIHIPFCKKICSYCDFPKMVSSDSNKEKYINRLIEEIRSYKKYFNEIDTVFIGGGTPNSISLTLLEKIFIEIKDVLNNSVESSIELNPEFITEDLCILLKKYKFNRVSLGVETIDDDTIKLINRNHNKKIALDSIDLLKKYEITNINCDFIFGFPNETLEAIDNNLDFFLSLDIPHISYYSLILEEKTIFYYKYLKKEINFPSDDLVADMYYRIKKKLEDNGYNHYEISNFARCGYESKHNLKYWNQEEYIGCGLSAAGYISDIRYENKRILKDYLNSSNLIDDSIKIENLAKKKEFLMMRFRLCNGISLKNYENKFNSSLINDFSYEINKLINKDLIEISNGYIKVKSDKLFIANLVFREFV